MKKDRWYDILNDGRPISIICAGSPKEAIKIYKTIHKKHHFETKLGHLTAAPRIQEENQ